MEVLRWAIKVFGAFAAGPGGPVVVAPHIGAIVNTMLAPACSETTVLACAETLCIIVAGFAPAKERLEADRVRVVKSMQLRARDLPLAQRDRMLEWAKVVYESLTGYVPPGPPDEPNKVWMPMRSEGDEDGDEEVFPYDLEKKGGKK